MSTSDDECVYGTNVVPVSSDTSSSDTTTTTTEATTTTDTTTQDTPGGSSGGGSTDAGNGTSNIDGTTTETNSDGTTTTTNTDGSTTTQNLDGSTTTSSMDANGNETYTTTGEGPYNDTTTETVTHNDDGTTAVDTTTVQGDDNYVVKTTDNGDGTHTNTETTDYGVERPGDPPKSDDTEPRTTDAHNQLDPNGTSVEPDQPTDDSDPPADPDSDGNEDPEGDPDGDNSDNSGDTNGDDDTTPHEGEQESSDSAEMSGDGMSGDPGMDGDGGHVTLPPGIIDLLKGALEEMHQPGHGGDTVNVIDTDGTGDAEVSGIAVPVGLHTVHDSPMDPSNPMGGDLADGPGRGNGLPGTVGQGPSGDLINTLDGTTQSTGPEERNHNHEIKHEIPSSGGSDLGVPSNPTLTVDTGNQNTTHLIPQVGTPVETAAQHAVRELKDALAQHNEQGPHDALKDAADKVATTVHAAAPLAHGVHFDDGGHLGDFIKAAQGPVRSGLMAALQPAGADALHHASAGTEIGHDLGLHGADDLHAVISVHATPIAALHDIAVEHHALPETVEALWQH